MRPLLNEGKTLVRFYDVDDPDGPELARLYLNILPPVGTEVRIREKRPDDTGQGETAVTRVARWIVDHHRWSILRSLVVLPDYKDGTVRGWQHRVSMHAYLRRERTEE